MKRKKIRSFCAALLVFLQVIFVVPVQAEGYSEYIDRVIDMAKERYYQDVSEEDLIKGALKGIFGAMDEYTTFFNMEEAENFLSSMEGNYQGIGVEIIEVSEGVMIARVFSNSPAEGAGILKDDIITQVNGSDIKGFSSQNVAALIRGESGTYVELGIIRGDSTEIMNVRVQRGVVNISPVSWRVDGDVMYIKLSSFSGNSTYYFEQALKEMDAAGIIKMVLDLRDNPGGEVNQAVNIARHLVRMGTITKLDFKSEDAKDVVYNSFITKPKYIPAILVNGNSASASEILASAVQDSRDGFLVGTNTFGKGVVQNLYPILSPAAYEKYREIYGESIIDGYDWINKYNINIGESELIGWTKITTGHYLTRSGNMIHGVGITPDFTVDDYKPVYGINIHDVYHMDFSGEILLNGIGNDVYNTERILIHKGYELEVPDNILDVKTSECIKLYQKEKGIDITGTINNETRSTLNDELKDLRLKVDAQYAKAIELLELFN